MNLIYAENDMDWQIKIAEHYGYKCAWAGCKANFGLGSHHIIRRSEKKFRLMLINGILLCGDHHERVEKIKGTPKYEKIMTLLIGKKRWGILKRLEEAYRKIDFWVGKINMPKSEIMF